VHVVVPFTGERGTLCGALCGGSWRRLLRRRELVFRDGRSGSKHFPLGRHRIAHHLHRSYFDFDFKQRVNQLQSGEFLHREQLDLAPRRRRYTGFFDHDFSHISFQFRVVDDRAWKSCCRTPHLADLERDQHAGGSILDRVRQVKLMGRKDMEFLRRGQALLTATLTFTVICGMLGLAVDLGWDYFQRQSAQSAADAAAQAGAAAAIASGNIACGTSVVCQAKTACPANVVAPANTVQTACAYGEANGFGTDSKSSLQIASGTGTPPSAPGVISSYYVSATVTRNNPSLFAALVGYSPVTVAAQSTAAVVSHGPSNCLYVLDLISLGALTLNNAANARIDCTIVVDSISVASIDVGANSRLTANGISTVGGYLITSGGYISVLPTTGIIPTVDPLSALPPVTVPTTCNFTNYVATGSTTLYPGTYCGGISVSNNATTNFTPGTYIINTGSLHINPGATASGSGVLFYLTGNPITYGGVFIEQGSTTNFSAPTTGPYQGILFYQDRSLLVGAETQLVGGAAMQLAGTLYFPSTAVSYANGSNPVAYATALIAKDVLFNGDVNITSDPTGLSTGLSSKAAVLVQ
jgi:Flp pilus assembly protein TadG